MTVHVDEAPEVTLVGLQTRDDDVGPLGATLRVAVVLPPNVAVSVTDWVDATEPAVAVNVATVALAGTVTDGGAGSATELLDEIVTVLPPAGAAGFTVTVHVVTASGVKLDGVQTSEDTPGPLGATVTVAVVLLPKVAVTATVCGVVTEPDVAVNVTELVAPGTVTEAGTGSALMLFDAKATALPLAGAIWFSVTVHVVAAPDVRLVGLQTTEDTLGGAATVTDVLALPPKVAVSTTIWDVATAPAVAVNAADVAPAGTVMVAGDGSTEGLFEASATVLPPAGAAWVRVTAHVVAAPERSAVGSQASEDTDGLGATVSVAVALPPSVAVRVTA